MAHEITSSDKLFTVRKPSWHGLEDLLSDYPTRQEAEALVHGWHVEREPLYRKVVTAGGEDNREFFEEYYELVPEFELNVRSDTSTDLAVVPSERIDVQPYEMWDLAELIQGEDKNVMFETAGSYNEGRNVWILIRLNEPIEIKGDPQGATLPYFALQNGYAPGIAFRGQAINIRILCANTSRLADLQSADGSSFSFAHTTNLRDRVEEAREALAEWREGIQEWKRRKEHLAELKVTTEATNWFIEEFIPMPNERIISDRVRENVEIARLELLTELYGGMNSGITGTALGLFEAASSWNEHVRAAASQQSRFKRALLEPTSILSDAAELALKAAVV